MSVMHSILNHFYKDCNAADKLDKNNSIKYVDEYVKPKIWKDYKKAILDSDKISFGCTNTHLYLASKLELRIPNNHTHVCDYFFDIVKQELTKNLNDTINFSTIKIDKQNYYINILVIDK